MKIVYPHLKNPQYTSYDATVLNDTSDKEAMGTYSKMGSFFDQIWSLVCIPVLLLYYLY